MFRARPMGEAPIGELTAGSATASGWRCRLPPACRHLARSTRSYSCPSAALPPAASLRASSGDWMTESQDADIWVNSCEVTRGPAPPSPCRSEAEAASSSQGARALSPSGPRVRPGVRQVAALPRCHRRQVPAAFVQYRVAALRQVSHSPGFYPGFVGRRREAGGPR